MPKRRPKPLRSLLEIAEAEGYEPGAFLVRRMQEITAKLEGWRHSVQKYNKVPTDDVGEMGMSEFKDLYAKECNEALRMESAIMEYFHPKMRSTDSVVTVDGEVSLYELLTRERDGS